MAWKKTDDDTFSPSPSVPTPPSPPREARRSDQTATIGPSIAITGELSGEEDLMIQGRLDGKVLLKQHNVTVGSSGRVKADIYGHSIRVDGEVEGNLYGEEEVIVRDSGKVRGNIVAPRVTLENGAKFKGSIDMEPKTSQRPMPAPAPSSTAGSRTASSAAAGTPGSSSESRGGEKASATADRS